MESETQSQFKSLLRAIDILGILEEKAPLSVGEISELSGVPRSTTYKYLAVMKDCRLLNYEQNSQKYELGLRLFELGASVQSRILVDKIARPYMEELSNQLEETVALAVADGNWAVYVEKVEPDNSNQIVLLLKRGVRFSLHAGATGKILLAFQPDESIEAYLRKQKLLKYTENTTVDPDKIRKELEIIRTTGYAFSEEEISQGVRALAAPIFNHERRITAGLVVFGPTHRIEGPKKEKALNLVMEYSKKISERLKGKEEGGN